MLPKLLIAFSIMALCVAIHAMGLMAVYRWMRAQMQRGVRGFWPSTWCLIVITAGTVVLHMLQILAWALVYAVGGAMPDLTTAAYFSAVTYTTTGYGDIVLPEKWRLVGGIEALTGILMCGLSAGLFVAVFNKIFAYERDRYREPPTS